MKHAPLSTGQALSVLGLTSPCSSYDIESAARRLLKTWHPDTCQEEPELCQEKTREIIAARDCLMDYLRYYPVDFNRISSKTPDNPDAFWQDHFGADPLWSPPGTRKKRKKTD